MSDIFSDPSILLNRNFGYALGSYPAGDGEDESKMSLLVGEDGTINLDGPLLTYPPTDPIDSTTIPEFSPTNNFIEGIRRAIPPFPLWGVVAFPIYLPSTVEAIFGLGVGVGGSEARFPSSTPPGFVPCAGVTVTLANGGTAFVPNLGGVTTGTGDGSSTTTTTYAPPNTIYMMYVGDWVSTSPNIEGRGLGDFV